MRTSTYLLALFLGILAFTACTVRAQDEPAAAAADAGTEAPQEPVADEKPNPWKPQKLSGLAIGENSALAVPVPLLFAIFFGFIIVIGYVVFQIFEGEKSKERKAEEAKAKRAAKDAKKGSKKK